MVYSTAQVAEHSASVWYGCDGTSWLAARPQPHPSSAAASITTPASATRATAAPTAPTAAATAPTAAATAPTAAATPAKEAAAARCGAARRVYKVSGRVAVIALAAAPMRDQPERLIARHAQQYVGLRREGLQARRFVTLNHA